jgi:uncharacterized membrane protein YhaH (DUF805 family)
MNFTQFVTAMVGPLKKLTDFGGRSTRSEFWPFVFLMYAAQQIASYIAMNPIMKRIEAMETSGNQPDPFTFFSELMEPIFWISILSVPLTILLYFAAVTRRLHDTNRSGFHALPTLILQIAAAALMWHALQEFMAAKEWMMPSMFIPAIIAGLLNFAAFLYVLVLCVLDGTVGPNLYGDDPKGRTVEGEAQRKAEVMVRYGGASPEARTISPARIVNTDETQG